MIHYNIWRVIRWECKWALGNVIQVYIYNVIYRLLSLPRVKDRQQETERGLWYLTLFSSFFIHIKITYMK